VFESTANQGMIAATAQTAALNVRNGLISAHNFQNWISALADTELTALGFSANDVQLMRNMAADLDALWKVYYNQPLPPTYTLPYNFAASSTEIIGPG